MPKQAFAEVTKELRKLFPDVDGLRLRSANRSGRVVYQLLHTSAEGKNKATQLDATTPTQAYEAAKVLLTERTTGNIVSGRIPPAGLLRRAEIAARKEIEDRGLRQETEAAKVRALEAAVGFLTDRGMLLTADTLKEAIRATDRTKRERRSRLEACRLLAKQVDIALNTDGFAYIDPGAKRRELTTLDINLVYRALDDLERIPEWARYIFRMVACTGCRANAVFSMEIPRGPLTQGGVLRYVDTKRSKIKVVECQTTSMLVRNDQNLFNVWRLWEQPGEILALRHDGQRPTNDQLAAANRLTSDAQRHLRRQYSADNPRWLRFMTFRYLRHIAVTRLFEMGLNEYQIAELVSTSVEQLQKTYGRLYQKGAIEAVANLTPFTIPSTEDDARRAINNALQ